jgi:5-methylcytosine-specific restriction endonuclease McrA
VNRHKRRALELHSRIIRSIGACEACGSTWNLECAHVVTRARAATAVDLANAFCLCHVCHSRFTDHPHDWTDWVIRKIGRKAYDDLHHRSLAPVHANDHYWVTRLAELEERAG